MHEFCKQAAALSAGQRNALARRLQPLGPRPLGRTPGVNAFELAPAQERLWFLDRLAPGHPVHNVSAAVRLRGELDGAALELAIGRLVRRHEILRTTFDAPDGRPVQRVLPDLSPAIERVDLRGEPRGERQPAAERILVRAARQGFDIAVGPLLRAVLIRLDERENLLGLTLHHLVCDASSVPIIVGELLRDYRNALSGICSPATPPGLQFADYAVWQRYALAGEETERHRAYWAAALDAAPRETSIGFDRSPPAKPSFRGACATHRFAPAAARAIARLGRAQRATPFVVLTAAFSDLLRERGAGDDIILLATVADRHRSEASRLIGFFGNLVPLRMRLSGACGLGEVLARTGRTVAGALEHAALPFSAILSALRLPRGLQRPPLSGFGIVHEREIAPTRVTPRLELEPVELDPGIARADLTLSFVAHPDVVRLRCEYAADVFDRSTAEAMLAQLEEIAARGAGGDVGGYRAPYDDAAGSSRARGAGQAELGSVAPEISRPEPDGLAYVIYTSGSTGAPKGVAIEHRGLLNHVLAKIASLGLGERDCVAQTAPQTFDISIWQILAPLSSGGRVRIVCDADVRSPERLHRVVATAGVTVLQLVPPMVRELARVLRCDGEPGASEDAEEHGPRDSLRWLIATGDVLPPSVGRDWLRARPNVPLVNAYGPTECSDDVAQHVVEAEADVAGERVPIGRPVANARLFLLNDALLPVPRGAPGEICVAGVPVGRGYVGDAAATAGAFVGHPLAGGGAARLYRTGDRGRYRADGALEFLGRRDAQVKVRGFRIEPAEVEAVLLRHPAILGAAVAAVGGEAERTLVAWVALRVDAFVGVSALREFARRELPDPMVPSRWVLLDELPLTANGKIDREALPPIESLRCPPASVVVEPTTDFEVALVRIWRDLLRRDDVGVDDDFFLAGGDSIACVEMVARARRAGIGIAVEDVFEAPRVASLALRARRLPEVVTDQRAIEGEVGLTPIQRVFFAHAGDAPNHFNQSLCLAVKPELSASDVAAALAVLLDHHDALRSFFRCDPDGWTAACAAPGLSLEVAAHDLSALSEEVQRRRFEAEVESLQRSFDVGVPPLVRAAFFALGARRAPRVALVFHHLVVDATSVRILLEDLAALLAPRLPGAPPQLPPKTASLRDLDSYRKAVALRPDVGEEIEFWAAEAREATVALPRDLDDGENDAPSVRELVVELGAEDTAGLLRQVGPGARASAVELLLGAMAFALVRWTGRSSPAVFVETSGRDDLPADLDVTRTVGWLTAVFPVRIPAQPRSGVAECLTEARAAWRRARERGSRYGALVFAVDRRVRARMAELATPEISLNYLGSLMETSGRFSGFEASAEPLGAELGGRLRRPTLLDVEAQTRRGCLTIRFLYSANRHRRATIEAFAGAVVGALRAMAVDSTGRTSVGGTAARESGRSRDESRT